MTRYVAAYAVAAIVMIALGLMFFAVAPHGDGADWRRTLAAAALFGLFTYGTYDLTNQAIMKNWPVGVTLTDMAWGVVVSTVSAAAGKLTFDRFATG